MPKINPLFYLILLLSYISNSQNLFINEIITSNATGITDDDGSYEDWIELYNNGTESINLNGYGLTDNSDQYQWVFPEYWIQPGEHFLIWCSDKNRTNPLFPLHTNFKISADGETITLTDNNHNTVDAYPPIIIPQNHSYGRQTDGATDFVIFTQPTPGNSNFFEEPTETILPPTFSVNSGIYSSNFTLTLSHFDPEVNIIYTLDGSEPDENNLIGTTYHYKNQYAQNPEDSFGEFLTESFKTYNYNEAIEIIDRSDVVNKISNMSTTFDANPIYLPDYAVFKGTVVRAKAIKSGSEPSKTITKNYFITPEEENRYSLPIISLSLDENKLYDYEIGTNNAGILFDQWRTNNPNSSSDFWSNANYWRGGDEWELKANFSYFVNGIEVVNQDVGFRNHGNSSRSFRNRSWRLYARSQFGDSSINFPFFENQNYTSYKRLILRNSGNDTYYTMFRDAVVQQMFSHLNFETQAYQPSIVFLNAEYWGIFNIRERFDKHYFKRVYDINDGELDFLENNALADEGNNEHYLNMINFIENNSLNDDIIFQEVSTMMDIDNYTDNFIANIFAANYDWPHNNIEFWRKRTTEFQPNAPYGQDGRWRWVMKDMDMAFNGAPEWIYDSFTHNTLEHATSIGGDISFNPEWSTLLLRKLLENNTFRINFINRFADLLNTSFKPNRLHSFIDNAQNTLAPEIQEHMERWKTIENISVWNENVNAMKTFANLRPTYQRNHIREKFGISENINTYLFVNNPEHGYIKINTIEILPTTPGVQENPYPWLGVYFKGIPITLKAIPKPGFVFSHWTGASNGLEDEITLVPEENFQVTAHFIQATVQEDTPIYFWMMDNSVPNDTALTEINASFEIPSSGLLRFESCLEGYPFNGAHHNWRKASMERRNSPTDLNYIPEANQDVPFESANMRGLQIKQPFQHNGLENQLIFESSTSGYKEIRFGFAAKDENAADRILIDYSVSENTPIWTTDGLATTSFDLSNEYNLYEIDFSSITAVNSNPNFKIRLRFDGENMTQDNGDRVTFNNFSIKGTTETFDIDNYEYALQFNIYPNPVSNDLYIVHRYDSVEYKLFSIDGKLVQSGSVHGLKIDVSHLQNGLYILQLDANGKKEIKKIVKK